MRSPNLFILYNGGGIGRRRQPGKDVNSHVPSARAKTVSDHIRESVEYTSDKAKEVGSRIARAVSETPEYISLQRNDRALRGEMSETLEKIGKRVQLLYKRSKDGATPFERYSSIRKELERMDRLETEYRDNKAKLADVKRQIRKGR